MCARCDEQTDRKPAAIDPALVAILKALADKGLATPDPAVVGIAAARAVNERYFAAVSEPRVAVHRVETVTARSSDGHEVPTKVVVPLNVQRHAPALIYCHGGGYAFADMTTHDHVVRALAAVTGMVVFGVDYRRTPEYAYPKALEDTLAVATSVRGEAWQARFGHATDAVFIMGDSAGAHLALTTMLALRERNLPQLQGAALIYGMYARRFDTWSHHTYGDGSQGLSSDKMRWFWDQLLQGHLGGDALTEPLDASLADLPPLALFAAEVDCLLDDTLDFVEACKRQNHAHSFDLFRGVPHGFMHLSSVYGGTRSAMAVVANRLKQLHNP